MVELFANSIEHDQTHYSVASDLCLLCLPFTLLGAPDYNGLNKPLLFQLFFFYRI